MRLHLHLHFDTRYASLPGVLSEILRFWRLDTLHEVMRLPLPTVCELMVFAPDGQSLAVIPCPPASPPAKGELLVILCPRFPDP